MDFYNLFELKTEKKVYCFLGTVSNKLTFLRRSSSKMFYFNTANILLRGIDASLLRGFGVENTLQSTFLKEAKMVSNSEKRNKLINL